jgi:predicted RNA-binding Zn ribbon-like protein
VLEVADFNVKTEDEHSHKRQVKSGDHIRKLQRDTIDSLNNKMARQLNFFDYLKNIRRFDTTTNRTAPIAGNSPVNMESLEVIQKMREDIDTLLNANHNRIKEIQALQDLKKN